MKNARKYLSKMNKNYSNRLFYIVFIILSLFVFLLFDEIIRSGIGDIPAHTRLTKVLFTKQFNFDLPQDIIPVVAISYPLYHLLQKTIVLIFQISYENAALMVLFFAEMSTVLIVRYILNHIVEKTLEYRYLIDFISITSIMFQNCTSVLTGGRYYARQSGPNPIHNPTLILVRPLGILCFYYFVKMMNQYKYKSIEKDKSFFWKYAVLLFLSCLAKPSFAFVALPAFAIITLAYMIKEKNIILGLQVLGVTLPSLILLLVQYFVCFLGMNGAMDEHKKMQIVFGSFSQFTIVEVIAVTIATLVIPLLILSLLLIYQKKDMDLYYITAIIILFIGWIQMFFLTDGPHGNFSWGYSLAIHLSIIISMLYLYMSKLHYSLKILVTAIYGYQIYCGVQYFMLVCQRAQFWF